MMKARGAASEPPQSVLDRVLRYGVFPFHERVIRRRHISTHRRFIDASQWWSINGVHHHGGRGRLNRSSGECPPETQ